MMELRKKSGNVLAIGYGWIERMEFDTANITLHVGNSKILIKGRNLNAEARPHVKLFQGLTKYKVPFIQEADHSMSLHADKKAVVVESLEWEAGGGQSTQITCIRIAADWSDRCTIRQYSAKGR